MTPLSGSAPYCTAARLFAAGFRDLRLWLELLTDDPASVPTQADAENPAHAAGAKLLAALAAASGEIEEHAVKGRRYEPADLASLTGNSRVRLEELAADLAFWRLAKRRWAADVPAAKVTGVAEALDALRRLAAGETVFGLAEAAGAADAMSVAPLGADGPGRVVTTARRFFGDRSDRGR